MHKLKYERPYLKKLNAGAMNKFGTRTETQAVKSIDGIDKVRGKGLMIGFDVPEDIKDLRKKLLNDYFIFTGEAKPNVIRLLPAMNISRKQVDEFLDTLKDAIGELKAERVTQNA